MVNEHLWCHQMLRQELRGSCLSAFDCRVSPCCLPAAGPAADSAARPHAVGSGPTPGGGRAAGRGMGGWRKRFSLMCTLLLQLDVAIDGADEVDAELTLIKGGGWVQFRTDRRIQTWTLTHALRLTAAVWLRRRLSPAVLKALSSLLITGESLSPSLALMNGVNKSRFQIPAFPGKTPRLWASSGRRAFPSRSSPWLGFPSPG